MRDCGGGVGSLWRRTGDEEVDNLSRRRARATVDEMDGKDERVKTSRWTETDGDFRAARAAEVGLLRTCR